MAQIINKLDIVIITDIGSVDSDDVFAICLLSILANISIKGLIATHIYPTKKAQILKIVTQELGLDVPVYVGNGVEYATQLDVSNRSKFLKENSLFPALFGFPSSVYDPSSEKEWFKDFMKGYTDCFGSDVFNSAKIEDVSGHIFLLDLLKKYNPKNKLTVIVLSPMHDLAEIPTELYENMDLYVMGGGFEEEADTSSRKTFSINKFGYNWGVCPDITKKVLQKLSESKTSLTLISSSIVRRKDINISTDVFDKWVKLLEHKPKKLTKAIMADWFYSLKGNKSSQHKFLSDPLTLYLSIKQSYSYIQYDLVIADKIDITNYLQPLNNLAMFIPNVYGNVKLVTDFPSETKNEMLQILEEVLFK